MSTSVSGSRHPRPRHELAERELRRGRGRGLGGEEGVQLGKLRHGRRGAGLAGLEQGDQVGGEVQGGGGARAGHRLVGGTGYGRGSGKRERAFRCRVNLVVGW